MTNNMNQTCLECRTALEEGACPDPNCLLAGLDQSDTEDKAQLTEYRQRKIIAQATSAADRILLKHAQSNEELNYFTACLTETFARKTLTVHGAALLSKELLDRHKSSELTRTLETERCAICGDPQHDAKTHAEAAALATREQQWMDRDWVCPCCQTTNLAVRKFCRQCSSARPAEPGGVNDHTQNHPQ